MRSIDTCTGAPGLASMGASTARDDPATGHIAASATAVSQRRRRVLLGAAAALVAGVGSPARAAAPAGALEGIRQRGRLTVAVYQDLPPFHVNGKGIDVSLAQAMAQALGVSLSLLPFTAGEGMSDDLRNMVWRGHYLGFGPADVLLHVPVEAPLMQATPQVEIFAPYYRERVMIARDRSKLQSMTSLADVGDGRIAVPGLSLAGWLLIGSENGRWRNQLTTRLKDGTEAAALLQRGEVVAAAGLASELESVLGADPRFAIEPLPLPRMRQGWAVGAAVKRDATDLAQALQAAVNGLAGSGDLSRLFAAGGLRWQQP